MSGGFPLGLEICNGVDAGTNTGTTFGTNLTTGAANTYGSFVQLTASAPETEWISVSMFGGNNATSFEAAMEIAIGGAGSERVIVHDLVLQCNGLNIASVAFPISIPAGSRLSAAVQSQTASESAFYINVQLFDGSFSQMEGVAGVDSIGFNSASSQGTTVTASSTTHAKGSYSQLTASTPRDYVGFFFGLGESNLAIGAARALLDIAIGGSGSEQIILPNVPVVGFVSGVVTPQISSLYPIPIPAGTRVAARCQSSVASKNLDLTLYGLYQ